MATTANNSSQEQFTDVLKNIDFQTSDELSKKETGEKIAKKIYQTQMETTSGVSNSLNFFVGRAEHWDMLEKWSLGKQDMTQFLPFMNIVDANKSYAKIDMTPTMLGPQFVGTKVGSMANSDEYPCVSAIDDGSIDEKEQRQLEALFRMKEVQTINELQQKSGIQLEPDNVFVPDDELSAKVYFELEDRLPKEIRFEQLLNSVLVSNDYNRVIKPKLLRDNIVFGFEATQVEKEGKNKYSIRRLIPKNTFYNYIQSDSGKNELRYAGQGYNLKVADIRSKWGKSEQNPDGLTEQQIYDFAKMSAQNNPASPTGFTHQFYQQYSLYSGNTPWDDFSGYVIDFYISVIENDYYVSKTDSYGKENISPKKGVPKPASSKSIIHKKDKKRWYRCVYAPFANMLIYWGKPDLTILNYTDTEEAFCPISINIPNNNGEYIPSLFERSLEPLKEHALAKLKRKLLLGKLSPGAYRVDVQGARDVIDGTGKVYDWEEIVRIKDTTGVELWSSKGLDPLTPGNPTFAAATADPTMQNILQLSELINNLEAEIRVLLGVPVYLDGSDVGQRTAAKLAEGQTESSFNVTSFIPNGHSQLMEETLNKICILSWQDIVTDKKESSHDLINTKFRISIKMKMTDYEKQLLENDIQRYSQMPDAQGNPSLTPKDAFMLRQIEDKKLANWYLTHTWESNRKKAIEDSQKLQEQNAKVQQQSAQQASEQQAQLQQQQAQLDSKAATETLKGQKELVLLKGALVMTDTCISKGVDLPDIWKPLIAQVISNVAMPLTVENKQMQQGMQQMQNHDIAHQYAMSQQAQSPQEEQQEPMQEQPQQEMAEQ